MSLVLVLEGLAQVVLNFCKEKLTYLDTKLSNSRILGFDDATLGTMVDKFDGLLSAAVRKLLLEAIYWFNFVPGFFTDTEWWSLSNCDGLLFLLLAPFSYIFGKSTS